jgi:outer membrane protein OmpA-like peptidoglycan-associated protein
MSSSGGPISSVSASRPRPELPEIPSETYVDGNRAEATASGFLPSLPTAFGTSKLDLRKSPAAVFATSKEAQTPNTVTARVRVTDERQQIVRGATVIFTNADGQTVEGTTDENGIFSGELPPGRYVVHAHAEAQDHPTGMGEEVEFNANGTLTDIRSPLARPQQWRYQMDADLRNGWTEIDADGRTINIRLPARPTEGPFRNGLTTRVRTHLRTFRPSPLITFAAGSAEIDPRHHQRLNDAATYIQNNPDLGNITIQGFTDARGTRGGNESISQQRAEAVRDYLISRGVGSDRLWASGRGSIWPCASNRTEAGRARNRRVEFVLDSSHRVRNWFPHFSQNDLSGSILYYEQIRQIAAIMSNHEDYRIEIQVHTGPTEVLNLRDTTLRSRRDNTPRNLLFSWDRAGVIQRHLTALGVDPDRIEYSGWGSYHPLVPNTAAEADTTNSRIEFYLIERDRDLEDNVR